MLSGRIKHNHRVYMTARCSLGECSLDDPRASEYIVYATTASHRPLAIYRSDKLHEVAEFFNRLTQFFDVVPPEVVDKILMVA